MKWNNGKERARFEKEQEKLKKEYLAAGMTEEQIKKLYEYDLSEFNSERREKEHTQKLDFDDAEFNDKETDNPLFKKFLEAISITPEYSDSSRHGWIEDIENEKLSKALKNLSKDYIDILTDICVNGFSQTEIAQKRGVSRKAINNKISRIKKFLNNF